MLYVKYLFFILIFISCVSDRDRIYWDKNGNKEEEHFYKPIKKDSKKDIKLDKSEKITEISEEINLKKIIEEIPYLYHINNKEKLSHLIKKLIEADPNHPFIEKYSFKEPDHAIVIILPLSGKFEKTGKLIEASILKTNSLLIKPYKIASFDTQSDMFYRKEDLLDFIKEINPKFLIGGLTYYEAKEMIQAAAYFDLTFFTLANDERLTSLYNKLYIQSITAENTIYSVVKYAVEVKDFRKFAVLYPLSEKGKEYFNYFEKYINHFGAELTKIVSFDPRNSNLDRPISQLAGRDNPYKHPDFYKYIKKAEKIKSQYRKNRFLKRAEMKLRAIFDYEAIFLPIPKNQINYIVPVIASWDIPLLTNDSRLMEQVYHKYLNKQQQYVQIFGTSFWYMSNPQEYYNKYVNGVIIPSPIAIDLGDTSEPFNELFSLEDDFNIYKPLIFDLLNIIDKVFDRKVIPLKDYKGVMGSYFFYKNQLFKELMPAVLDENSFLIHINN